MNWLLESPWPALVGGGAALLLFAVSWWQTRQKALLWMMLAAAAITAVMLLVQWLVVTDREQIEATLERARAALAANDLDGVISTFADTPATAKLRSDVRDWGGHVKFSTVKTGSKRSIEINRHTSPPTATVEFLGAAYGEVGGQPVNYAGKVTVKMVLVDGQWKIESAVPDKLTR